jgi:hypothetical protein
MHLFRTETQETFNPSLSPLIQNPSHFRFSPIVVTLIKATIMSWTYIVAIVLIKTLKTPNF